MDTQKIPHVTIDLVLDRLTAKDVLRAVLHAILFHRLFGTVRPRTMDVLDVTMPGVQDETIEQLVDDKVDTFWKAVENRADKRGEITVTFAEKRQKRAWFSLGEEEVPWEQWTLNITLRASPPRPTTNTATQGMTTSASLRTALHTILTHTSSARGRAVVPPIRNQDGISPFPWKIGVWVGGVEVA